MERVIQLYLYYLRPNLVLIMLVCILIIFFLFIYKLKSHFDIFMMIDEDKEYLEKIGLIFLLIVFILVHIYYYFLIQGVTDDCVIKELNSFIIRERKVNQEIITNTEAHQLAKYWFDRAIEQMENRNYFLTYRGMKYDSWMYNICLKELLLSIDKMNVITPLGVANQTIMFLTFNLGKISYSAYYLELIIQELFIISIFGFIMWIIIELLLREKSQYPSSFFS